MWVEEGDNRTYVQQNITRSKEEAIDILKEYGAEINGSPDKFAELAGKYSDCGSHANGGDLGFFKPVRLYSTLMIQVTCLDC